MSACSKCLGKVSLHAYHELTDDCADWDCGFCDVCIEEVVKEEEPTKRRGGIYGLLTAVLYAEIERITQMKTEPYDDR